MTTKKSYPEEMFEQRLQLYRKRPRTKLPHHIEQETCRRVTFYKAGCLPLGVSAGDFFGQPPGSPADGSQALPFDLFDTEISYDACSGHAMLRGRCGSIVLDDTICLVAVARFFIARLQQQSCGECTMCRVGTVRMREMLERICSGAGKPGDIDTLEQLAEQVGNASRCEIGRLAAQAVLSTLDCARSSHAEHIRTGACAHGMCTASGTGKPCT
ncbi:MAG: NADH-ubiquinone oxidoreductase-F iron-sulfur binding region domain-containing protein [Pseudomonadota bacterium]